MKKQQLLKLSDFQNDYGRLVISISNNAMRVNPTERLILDNYMHIREECVAWVKKEHGLKLFV